jgi:hypothetical protein
MDSFDSSLSSSPSGRAEIYRPEEQIIGLASVFLSRGRSAGYGLYFSKARIIGVRKRRTFLVFGLALSVPVLALLLYLNFVLRFSGPLYGVFLLPFLPMILDLGLRRLRHAVPERIVRKNTPTTTNELGSRIDFELRREEIAELLMKHIVEGRLSPQPGYLRITPRSHLEKPIEIKIHAIKQFKTLREIVIEFAARQPQVRALEY